MTLLSNFLQKQGQLVLAKKQNAFLHTAFLAVIPYTDWLSLAVIALITLRKGLREGSHLLLAGMFVYFTFSSYSSPLLISATNTLLVFLPGFLAAATLRITRSWLWVAIICLIQVFIVAFCLQAFAPEFIVAQFQYIQHSLSQLQNESFVIGMLMDKGLNEIALANYLIGAQAIGILLSGVTGVMLARSVQAQLFNPGGYKKEMESFRGNKIGVLVLFAVLVAAHYGNVLAMNLAPVLLFCFLLAGISLGSHLLYNKKPVVSILLLVIPLVALPFVMLPVYVIFGSLDSLFNFRNYLPINADNRV